MIVRKHCTRRMERRHIPHVSSGVSFSDLWHLLSEGEEARSTRAVSNVLK